MGLREELSITSFEDYVKLRESSEELYEYIDGEIIKLWSPSVKHQDVVLNLAIQMKEYFNKSNCKVMVSPFDVFLDEKQLNRKQAVIPDISVMCDKTGFTDKRYIGVPTIIVEVLSTNSENDTFRKFNLYLRYGVREYWVIDAENKTFMIHTLDLENRTFITSLIDDYGILKSRLFSDLEIDMNKVFDYE